MLFAKAEFIFDCPNEFSAINDKRKNKEIFILTNFLGKITFIFKINHWYKILTRWNN